MLMGAFGFGSTGLQEYPPRPYVYEVWHIELWDNTIHSLYPALTVPQDALCDDYHFLLIHTVPNFGQCNRR